MAEQNGRQAGVEQNGTDVIDHAAWAYDPVSRIVTVGAVPCNACERNREPVRPGRAQVFGWVPCTACRGTGKRGNGKCRACAFHRTSGRHGMVGEYRPGLVPDYGKPLDGGVCEACDGAMVTDARRWGTGNAAFPDDIREQVLASLLPVQVLATEARLTRVEAAIGYRHIEHEQFDARALWVSSDYGRTWERLVRAKADGRLDDEVARFAEEIGAELRKHVRRVIDISESCGRDSDQARVADRIVAMVGPDSVRVLRIIDKRK